MGRMASGGESSSSDRRSEGGGGGQDHVRPGVSCDSYIIIM